MWCESVSEKEYVRFLTLLLPHAGDALGVVIHREGVKVTVRAAEATTHTQSQSQSESHAHTQSQQLQQQSSGDETGVMGLSASLVGIDDMLHRYTTELNAIVDSARARRLRSEALAAQLASGGKGKGKEEMDPASGAMQPVSGVHWNEFSDPLIDALFAAEGGSGSPGQTKVRDGLTLDIVKEGERKRMYVTPDTSSSMEVPPGVYSCTTENGVEVYKLIIPWHKIGTAAKVRVICVVIVRI